MREVKPYTTCITYVNTCTKNKFLITLAFDKWNLKDLGGIFMDLKADLHLHTSASDGKLSPAQLLTLAYDEGLNIIAITDHDTTAGIDSALAAAESLPIRLIPGIELSTQYNGETVHILGYFKDDNYKKEDFQKYLQDMKDHRIYRAKEIVKRLKEYFDIRIDYESPLQDAKGVIARPHIARAIIDAGYNYSWEYIFDRLLKGQSRLCM